MISIIIPVLNEEKTIESTLNRVMNLKGNIEVIVVDGGSHDKTRDIVEKYCKCIVSKKGRGIQMNKGAEKASGDILWFLHSDAIIHESSIEMIERTTNKGLIGGGFSLYFNDYATSFMRFVSTTSNWRAKYLGIYFGDQGIFVTRDAFLKVGQYESIEIMEDWDLSKKLRKHGKMCLLSCPIGTSARRFEQGGQLRTLLLMHKIKLLYTLGINPNKLNEIYKEAR